MKVGKKKLRLNKAVVKRLTKASLGAAKGGNYWTMVCSCGHCTQYTQDPTKSCNTIF